MKPPIMCNQALLSIDLSGKTCLITGGSAGLGLVTATQLARQGAHVIVACRNAAAGAAAVRSITAQHPTASLEVQLLDLSDLISVQACARQVLGRHDSLHFLLNNAGVMNTPLQRTVDGFEMQFGTNHLGHFYLTQLLLDAIKVTPGARIVNLSSGYHDVARGREGRIDFEDLNFERRKYDGWTAYAQSKLANLLHARELGLRLQASCAIAVSVHPGWVRTNLIRNTMPLAMQNFVGVRFALRRAGMLEPWQGVQASLHAILAPEVANQSGAYLSQPSHYRDKSCEGGGFPMVSPNPQANDPVVARRLWEESERLVRDALARRAVQVA